MSKPLYEEHLKRIKELEKENEKFKKLVINLRTSESRYRNLLENLPQKIFFKDKNSIYITCNENYAKDLNIRAEDIVGKTDYDFYDKDLAEKYRNDDKRIIKTGKTENIEEEYIIDGQKQYVHTVKTPVNDRKGNIYSILGIFWDITDRKKAEEEIKRNEEFLQTIYESSDIGIFIVDVEGEGKYRYAGINPVHEKLTGLKYEEITGKTPRDLEYHFGKETIKSVTDYYDNCVKKGESLVSEHYAVIDGKADWWLTKLTPLFNNTGDVYRLIGSSIIITARKNSENALKREKEFTEKALNAQLDTFFVFDPKTGEAIRWNTRFRKISGYTNTEIASMKALDSYYSREDIVKASDTIKRVLIEGYGSVEINLICKDGKTVPMEYYVSVIKDDKGTPKYLISIGRDISERIRLEEQLQIRQRMDSLGTLAGGIAHDFNNILVGIMGNLDLLEFHSGDYNESQKRILGNAIKSTERASELINQFQTLTGPSVSAKKLIDIYEIVNEVYSLLDKTTNKLIEKRINFERGKYFVIANPSELHQVFLNLATNSAHAIETRDLKPGDYIKIEASDYKAGTNDKTRLQEGDYIHLMFQDNGTGMSEEVINKAFDPLFTTKEKGSKKGQGLGLAMVYNIIVRLYNGHIYIDSEEGKETTFHIFLPKVSPGIDAKSQKHEEIKGGNEIILLVDDDEIVHEFVKTLLSNLGYTLIVAKDGLEAIELYIKSKNRIELVILDLVMPGMSGEMVFERLLNFNPGIKVIISSGQSEEFSHAGILGEAMGYLKKPYKLKDMARTIREVLDK